MAKYASTILKRWRFLLLPRSAHSRSGNTRSLSSSSSSSSVDLKTNGGCSGGGDGGHLPVLVVGAGPVGLVLSILLTKLGVKCAVIEKSTSFSQHPQAHFINNRSMELFHKLDGVAEDIQKLQPPVDLWRKFIYCSSLSGSILGSVDHMQPQDFDKIVSPVSVAHFSQYKLVKLLIKKLEKLGFDVCTPGSFEGGCHGLIQEKRIYMGLKCISVNPTTEGIEVGTSFLNEGRVEERNLHCSILVGSDGARSTVRKLVGIEMEGERDLQKLISVHFVSRDLGQYLLRHRPGMLFFIFNSEAIGVLVAHDLKEGEFVLQIPYYPPQQSFEDFNFKVCEQIIFKLVGRELEDVAVVDIKPWVMHAEVAEKFIACNNRVILVGDAAHRFPPAGGFGMNTGIQDAHNLAWKISALLKDAASPSIIQTYEMERRPIAIFNTALSVENFKAAMSVPSALGLDPTIANSVHQVINSRLGSIFPSSFQKVALEGIFSVGRSQLSKFFLNENNPLGSLRLARVRSILEEGKSLQLQFPAEDLGFRYHEGAIFGGCNDKMKGTINSDSNFRRGSREYVPSAKPGSRLPHMQVRVLNAPSEQGTFSTLDLVPGDKLEFLLIIAPEGHSYDLARVACKVAETFKVSLKVCVIWPQGSSVKNATGSRTELEPLKNYVDVEEVERSSVQSWWEMCQMTSKGVILVRPDDHIGWSTELDGVEDLVQQVERVFSKILRADRNTS